MKITASRSVTDGDQPTVTTSKTVSVSPSLRVELVLLILVVAGGGILFGFRPDFLSPLWIVGETLFVAYLVAATFQIVSTFRKRNQAKHPVE